MLSGLYAHAASSTWAGNASTSDWGAGGNWAGGVVPGSTTGTVSDTATFTNTTGSYTTININSSSQYIGSISFTGSLTNGFTIGAAGANAGNSLFLTTGGQIALTSSNTNTATLVTQTFNAPLVVQAGANGSGTYTFTNNSTGKNNASLVFNGNIGTNATGTMTLQLGGNNTTFNTNYVNGAISNGSGGGVVAVTMLGSSADQTWVLAGPNTYSGPTTINSGVLEINADSGLGVDPSSAQAGNVILSGGTLNGTSLTPGSITLNANRGIQVGNAAGTVLSGAIGSANATNLVLNGNISNANTSVSDTLTFNTTATGTAQTSTITLGGAVLNTSAVNIAGTDLNVVSNGGSIGSAALTVTSGTLLLGGGNTVVSGGIAFAGGAISAGASNVTLSGGDITVGSGIVGRFNAAAGDTLTVSNNIVGAGSVWASVNGTGTVQLTGNNTYSGTTYLNAVSGGGPGYVLDVDGNSSALGTSTVLYQWAATTNVGLINSSATTAVLQNNIQFESGQNYATTGGNAAAYFGGSGNLTFEGNDYVLGYYTSNGIDYIGTGTLTFAGAGGGVGTGTFALASLSGNSGLATFFLTGTNGELVIDNNLIDTTATGTQVSSVTLRGGATNTFILAGNNSYSGTTTLTGGSTYMISGNNTTTGPVNLSSGTLDINSNTALGTGTLNITTGSTIDNTSAGAVTDSNAVTLSNASGISTLAYGGTKALTLGALSTFTNFTSGTITLGGTGSNLSFSSFVSTGTSTTPNYAMTVNGAGNTLTFNSLQLSASTNTATMTATFQGTGNVNIGGFVNGGSTAPSNFTYNGTGTATLSNASGLHGTLKENNGTMVLSGDNTGQTGTLSLSGGTLDLNHAKALTTTAVNNFGATTGTVSVAFDNTSGGSLTETSNPNINLYQSATFGGSNSLNLGTGTVAIQSNNLGITISGTNTATLGIGTLQSAVAASTTFNLTDTGGNNTFSVGTISINSGATVRSLTIGGGANITVGTISGGAAADSLVFSNSGTLTITGTTTYTGGTTLGSGAGTTGEIYIASGAGMVAGTGTTVVLSNGNLGGLGTVNGLVAMSGNGAINLADGKIGTLTIGSMTVATTTQQGDFMQFEIGAGSIGTDKLAIGGGLTIANGQIVYVNLENLNGIGTQSISSGTYTLMSYTGSQVSLSDFAFSNTGGLTDTLDGDTLTLVENGDNLQVVVTAPVISNSFYFTGSNGSDFATAGNYSSDITGTTTQTGTIGSASDVFIAANPKAGTHDGPNVNSAVTIDSLTFNSNGAGATVGGTGTLTILGTNNSGVGLADTATGGSTETVSAPIALGADQSWSVTNSGNTLKVTGQVSGAHALTTTGPGTIALAHASGNIYTGGTTVSSGTLLVQNTSGSATGTGSVTVNGGATLGGNGSINATGGSIAISGGGTTPSTRANVRVGLNSATDTNTSNVLTLQAAGVTTIANANLTFNLNTAKAGGLGGTANGGAGGALGAANSGTELSVGNSNVAFGTGVNSVQFTLNLQGEPAIIAANTPYVLIAGTGLTTDSNGVSGGQYSGLTLGTVTNIAPGVTETLITGSNLALAFGNPTDAAYYGANSYLVLYQNSASGVDDIDVIVVPEPGTWAMILGGLALLVVVQRSRRRNRS